VIANVDRESSPILPLVHPNAGVAVDYLMGNIFLESRNLFGETKFSR